MATMADHLRETRAESQDPQAYEGIVLDTLTSISAGVTVELADGEQVGPCPWMPRVNTTPNLIYPQAGDRALILIADEGQPWCVGYWPYG